ASNGTCSTDSTASSFSDINNTPGTPSITSITDNNPCAQDGILVNFTPGAGATSHDLLKDGVVVVTGYTSGTLYNPGDAASHIYTVSDNQAGCSSDSSPSAFTDMNTTPGAPNITSITDESICTQSGIRINFTAGPGALSHDLIRDGIVVVSGYVSGALYD